MITGPPVALATGGFEGVLVVPAIEGDGRGEGLAAVVGAAVFFGCEGEVGGVEAAGVLLEGVEVFAGELFLLSESDEGFRTTFPARESEDGVRVAAAAFDGPVGPAVTVRAPDGLFEMALAPPGVVRGTYGPGRPTSRSCGSLLMKLCMGSRSFGSIRLNSSTK
jgi:hypothetical protein